MSVSQNIMAFFNAAPSRGVAADSMQPAQGETSDLFSDVLASQQGEQLNAFMALLEGGEDGLPDSLEETNLAAGGNVLPQAMQDWLEQLSEAESAAGQAVAGLTESMDPAQLQTLAEEWSRWLSQARGTLGAPQSGISEDDTHAAGNGRLLAAGMEGRGQTAVGSASSAGLTQEQVMQLQSERDARQENGGAQGKAERAAAADLQVQQRSAELLATPDSRAAFAAKLAEALEPLSGRRADSDADAMDALQRPGQQGQAAAQGALSARPVLAASQTLGVPFGQAGWGDAILDKMQWMSSQNLRSVEIRIDPAELGPLEIHIQTRGQEHQVQFVSQNPSVREALEAQMFRLRESFSQQGMDLVDVSVGDAAVGQQARHEHDGSQGQDDGRAPLAGVPQADESGLLMAADAVNRALSERLVDYYA